jgi:mRNA-degrading endonuclease toxin of MazEF toxin-antitoxin module
VRWAALPPPAFTRPVVLVNRESAYPKRTHVLVVPVTGRVRGLRSEVSLDGHNGLAHPSVANCDTIQLAAKSLLERRLGELDTTQAELLDDALRYALGLDN